ncbi:MAG: diguanylate cyclase [Trueperaceae bacterium]|nr:MAG: diguanylate cyclase [Trueperaceae bacterium]
MPTAIVRMPSETSLTTSHRDPRALAPNASSVSGHCYRVHMTSVERPPRRTPHDDEGPERRLLERVPGVLFQLDVEPDGTMRFPYVTANAAANYGIDTGALASGEHGALTNVHPDDRAALLGAIKAAIDTLENVDHTFRLSYDRGERWLRVVARPEARDDGGVAFYGVTTDVTAATERQGELEREITLRSALVALTNDLLKRDLDERFYQHVIERAVELVPGADAGSIVVHEPDDHFRFTAAIGFDLAGLQGARIPARQMTIGAGERPRIVDYTGAHAIGDHQVSEILATYGRLDEIRSTLAVPVVVAGVPAAYLNLDSFRARDAFGDRALGIAEALAVQVAVAMQRLELERRLVHVATHDELTGLPNRLLYQQRLEQAIAGARRHARRLALLMLDLDGFKPVNDRFGHAAGDAVLRQVAQRLRAALRAEDTVARIGGDEFVVLIEHPVTRAHALRVADKLDRSLRAPYDALGSEVELRASIGVALFPDDADAPDRLLKVADDAMFAVKDGRAAQARQAGRA